MPSFRLNLEFEDVMAEPLEQHEEMGAVELEWRSYVEGWC